MNNRIEQLRKQSIEAENTISHERAFLLTEFYKSNAIKNNSIPVQRALAFKYIMENKKIVINPHELIVGERGDAIKATPTYPEICLHSVADLEIMHNRQKVSYKSNHHTRQIYQNEIIPFWEGNTIRDKIFSELPENWKEAYQAGIFTEFLEQRAPGHTVLDDKIYYKGLREFQNDIEQNILKLDFYNDNLAFDKKEYLKAMSIAIDGIICFSNRYANQLEIEAAITTNDFRKNELLEMSKICRKVPTQKPETFHEALQHYWFIHVGVITELNPWDSFNPGRLDQHLYPFYKSEIEAGTLTTETAKELLMAFWVKFNNHPAPPKMGVTAKESNTYTDFALINVGGLKAEGSDAVNELSYLILDVVEEMRILQPSSMIQLSKKNPDRFLKRALKIIKTGFGQPSIFNSDSIIQELVAQGKKLTDARNGGASGCVESGTFGKESYILTGYFNLTKILEITLFNGIDPVSGKQISPQTGDAKTISSMEMLFEAFAKQLNHFIDIKILGNNIIERIYAKYMPAPFLSVLIDDCIENGIDYNAGGARYNTRYIQGVGLGSITDSLSSIKFHVFDNKELTLNELQKLLFTNFEKAENWQQKFLLESPKYGNDNDYADDLMQKVFQLFYDAVNGRPTVQGGSYRINLLPTTSHIYFGSKIGATPDGRKAGKPLSEGVSPVQGADRSGPTAVLKSAAKIDHLKTGGTLLNQRFSPQFFESEEGITQIAHLVRSYFKLDGHHIQFNVIDSNTLKKAKAKPDSYRNLIVRVAGYSDYFVDLTEELQDEIIRRTEHAGV